MRGIFKNLLFLTLFLLYSCGGGGNVNDDDAVSRSSSNNSNNPNSVANQSTETVQSSLTVSNSSDTSSPEKILTWEKDEGVESFKVSFCNEENSCTDPIETTEPSVSLSSLDEDDTFTAHITVVDSEGNESSEPVVSDAFIPGARAPSNFQVIESTTTSMEVSFQDNSTIETAYEVYYCTTFNCSPTEGTKIDLPNNASSFEVTGLINGQPITVAAKAKASSSSLDSPLAIADSATVGLSIPKTLDSIAAGVGSGNDVVITFSNSSNAAASVAFEVLNNSNVLVDSGTADPADGSFIANGLTLGQDYTVRVKNTNSEGDSSWTTMTYTHANNTLSLTIDEVYSGKSNWMDYVKNDGTNRLDATGTFCDGSETTYLKDACIHGAAVRKIDISDFDSCDNLTGSDLLDIFEWSCIDNGSTITFYSTGIKRNKGLKDAIDGATGTSFRVNQFILNQGAMTVGESVAMTWWTNTLTALPDNSNTGADTVETLTGEGTIYTLTADRATMGYNINDHKVGIVLLNDAVLSWGNVAYSNNSFGTGETASPSQPVVIGIGSQNFTWIEGGQIFSSWEQRANRCLYYVNSKFNTIKNLHIRACAWGAQFTSSPYNSVIDSRVSHAVYSGVFFNSSNNNYTENMSYTSSGPRSLELDSSNYTLVNEMYSTRTNVLVLTNSHYNTFYKLRFSSLTSQAISQGHGNNYNTYVDVVFSHVNSSGSFFYGSNNKLIGVTNVFSSSQVGMTSANSLIHNAAFITQGGYSFHMGGASVNNQTVSQMAISQPTTDEYAINVNTNANSSPKFTGVLMLEASAVCSSGNAGDEGMDTSCNFTSTNSDATVINDLDGSASFVGEIGVDDSVNTFDVTPVIAHDWTFLAEPWLFENEFRVWGENANMATAGTPICMTGRNCSIWDTSLASSDTELLNRSNDGVNANATFSDGDPCPSFLSGNEVIESINMGENPALDGDNDGICEEGETCDGEVFLRLAQELMFDGVGDDDGLCESNEDCVYTPNFGAYQGHGDLISCDFSPGTLTGITIYAYENNGR